MPLVGGEQGLDMGTQQWENLISMLEQFGRNTGQSWSESNSQFEKTNPTLLDRAGRSLNPMTGFGSAIGAMHDGANTGSPRDMGIAFLQSLPLFGATKLASLPLSATKDALVLARPTLKKMTAGAAGSVTADELQAQSSK